MFIHILFKWFESTKKNQVVNMFFYHILLQPVLRDKRENFQIISPILFELATHVRSILNISILHITYKYIHTETNSWHLPHKHSSHTEQLKSILKAYHERINSLEDKKYDVEYIVKRKDIEVQSIITR